MQPDAQANRNSPLMLPSQRLLQRGSEHLLPELKPVPDAVKGVNRLYPACPESSNGTLVGNGVALNRNEPQRTCHNDLFVIKPTSVWSEEASNKPIPRMLFDAFWYEGEVSILFSDSNMGKSILAVQIANSISRGERIPGFHLEAPAQKVLYFDFELTDKQFEARYSDNYQDHYFTPGKSDNFLRAEINPEADLPKEFADFESYLCHSLEQAVLDTGAKVLLIDNITYLGSDTEKAKNALPLMKQLQSLKKKHGLSMLVLAHTPKRDNARPITKNDIQGSKMFINFCDSGFAIGASAHDAGTRYLKQVKQRQTEERYGAENVVLCQIVKRVNFLQFEFIGFGSESQHLRQLPDGDREQQVREAVEMRSQGKSNVFIATHFGVSEGAVRKWLKKAEAGDAPF